jgi:hypothetical protein
MGTTNIKSTPGQIYDESAWLRGMSFETSMIVGNTTWFLPANLESS